MSQIFFFKASGGFLMSLIMFIEFYSWVKSSSLKVNLPHVVTLEICVKVD